MTHDETAQKEPALQDLVDEPSSNAGKTAERSSPRHRRMPSDEPRQLGNQLAAALEQLRTEADSGDALRGARLCLLHAHALTWRGVARGDFDAPRRMLDHLLDAQPFADARLPELSPAEQAAVEIDRSLQYLYRATEALEELRTQARLADSERSATEREVLRVLLTADGQFLRRGQIHERLQLEERPTVARIGQILVDLHEDGLLLRQEALAQGNPQTRFYALSPHGWEVCESLELSPEPDPEIDLGVPLLNQALRVATSPEEPPPKRRIAIGFLCKAAIGERGVEIVLALYKKAVRSAGTPAEGVVEEVFRQVASSSIGGQVGTVGERHLVAFREDRGPLSIVARDPFLARRLDGPPPKQPTRSEIASGRDHVFTACMAHLVV